MLLFPLLLRNLTGEEVKEFTKNHTANKWQVWDLNSVYLFFILRYLALKL